MSAACEGDLSRVGAQTPAIAPAPASTPAQQPVTAPAEPGDPYATAQALVALGPRVAGTPATAQASSYLVEAYRRAGYVTEVQTFTYSKFQDLGSSLNIGGTTIEARALNGSTSGRITAPLVAVPNLGRPADFAAVDVRGAVAIVRRGEIRFSEKVQNAAAAGAVSLIIINNEPGQLLGAVGGESRIPALTLSGERGGPLLEQARRQRLSVDLNVNTRQGTVTGRNVIAHLEGVDRPSVVLGGHYDSVQGSPGANDNASGTAVVLEIARQLKDTPLARQAWFVAFDGEEDGLHGSKAFVKTAGPQFLTGLKGMLNFDMVGVNDGLRVGGNSELTALAKAIDPKISTFDANGGSDHASFAAADVPVIFFYRGQDPNYHSPNDRVVDSRLLNETARIGLGVVKQLLAPDSVRSQI
ncbi:M28 family peptidase [Leptolyngbya sp. FACHB-261]|nr:M28 family peptidase [Leptolyngbya sp. FACHB-261]